MFERFTDRARRVVVLAQEEARLLNHNYIGTEHVLLGLIAEGDGVAAKVLDQLGISLEAVRGKVEAIIGEGTDVPSGHIPFTPRSKKVLELSLREALQLGHNYIGTEHILLGLVREGEGVAAQILVNLGADLSTVREGVIQQLSGYRLGRGGRPGGPPPRPNETPAAAEANAAARRLAAGAPIGSHHQLLGLLQAQNSMAAKVMAALGVTREAVEQQLAGLEPAGTTDETPEEAGARRIRMRVQDTLLTLEIDDPELAASLAKAMVGRKARIITGTDPEAAGFPNLWSAVSRTVDDLTRRLRYRSVTAQAPVVDPAGPPPGWDPTTLAAGYVIANTTDGPVGHLEVGAGVDPTEARAWLRTWLEENRSQLVGPPVEEPASACAMWALVSRSGRPFGMQRLGFDSDAPRTQPVPVAALIEYALADLAA